MSYCAARLHAISSRPRSSHARRSSSTPPSLRAAGDPFRRTLRQLAT
ncbi:MAG: hypothetical protein V3T81_00085 [Thermoanaerobaculia bacterium]